MESSIRSQENTLVCDICRKHFTREGDTNTYIRVHTSDGRIHVLHSICEICKTGKWAINSENGPLIKHYRVHTGEESFVREICAKAVTHKRSLERHHVIHTEEKPFECEICKKSFSSNQNLKRHLLTHTGEKPFVCEMCGKGFAVKSNLNQHVQTHSGEKPFVCKICGKRFACSRTLEEHCRLHTGPRHICGTCGKVYPHISDLRKHFRVHALNLVCDICGKEFSRKDILNEHRYIHTGEKPFVCEICGRGFSQRGPLIVHRRKHSEKKICGKESSCNESFKERIGIDITSRTYECQTCKATFKEESDLNRHHCSDTSTLLKEVKSNHFRTYSKKKSLASAIQSYK